VHLSPCFGFVRKNNSSSWYLVHDSSGNIEIEAASSAGVVWIVSLVANTICNGCTSPHQIQYHVWHVPCCSQAVANTMQKKAAWLGFMMGLEVNRNIKGFNFERIV
jgi:hypothetical protein